MVILLAEDEPKIANFVKQALEQEQFTVEIAKDGEIAAQKAAINDYDLIILDVVMPKKNGFEVLKELRTMNLQAPVLILTAKFSSDDRVEGLNEGADDYLPKPFDLNELIARVRALARRNRVFTPSRLEVGGLIMETRGREVSKNNKPIALTGKEYKILELFMRNPGIVLSRTMINEKVWGFNYVKSNIIDVYMTRLRKKINSTDEIPNIITIHGMGYKLKYR